MEQSTANEIKDGEISIFDDLKLLPVYYSERAVYVFSLLMGVFFGSVLMAMNFKNTDGRKGIAQVLVFGFVFTVVELWVLSLIPGSNTGITFGVNIGGALVLNKLFWEKYIGKGVNYIKRSVVVPAIIAIVLALLVVGLIFMAGMGAV